MVKRQALILLMLGAVGIVLGVSPASAQAPETIFFNGKVLTVDANNSTAQAVAVSGTKIAAVGTDADVMKLAGPNTIKVDMKGRTLMPGFIHTHVHLEELGPYAREAGAKVSRVFPVRVRGLKTKDAVLTAIKDVIAAFQVPPGEWMYFEPNWTASQAPILFRDLNAAELDKAAPNNPIIVRTGMTNENICLMNGVALKEMWRKYGDFLEKYGRYWIDNDGKPSGILEPPASRVPWTDDEFVAKGLGPKPEDAAPYYRKMLMESYTSNGVTALSGALNTFVVNAYKLIDDKKDMPLRYAYGSMQSFAPGQDLKKYKVGDGTETLFIASMSARATDGGGIRMCVDLPRNNDAIMKAAGQGDSSDMNRVAAEWFPKGQCDLDIEYSGGGGGGARGARLKGNYFVDWYNALGQAGGRSANSHVAGDRSVTMMIDAWEKIDKQKPGSVKGWAFDHCNLVNPKDIPRAAKLGLMFSCNPGVGTSSNPESGGRSALVAYGPDVLNTYAAPFASMVKAGINVSMEANPWSGLETMITRKDQRGQVWGPQERVDRATAIRIATQNGANYILKGKELGSIEKGKFADLVILDKDIMTVPEDDISTIRPVVTMMGGKSWFVRTDFSTEANYKPAGAEVTTQEELQKRRPAADPDAVVNES